MKKIVAILLVALLLLCILPVSATNTADASVSEGCNTLDSQAPVLGNRKLIENATAMLLYETNTDTLMYAYNADERISPASLVKILTALIVIEKGTLSDVVTVHGNVLATLPYDAMMVGLHPGEVLTVKDLLYCMMVASGNDAAVVLADHILGSQNDFVDEMNRYADEFGCINTNFTNAHGLHNENQYTTARDVAKILSHALKNDIFNEIFGTKKYTVPATNKSPSRELITENYLLNNDDMIIHYDKRVVGSRTAVANDKSRSIASVAKYNDMNLISIVIGAKSEYEEDGYTVKVFGGFDETRKLLDAGFYGYKAVQVLHFNQVLKQVAVPGGNADVTIGTHDLAFSVIPENATADSLIYRYIDEVALSAPIQKGQRLSTLQVWCEGICIAQTELYAMNDVPIYTPVRLEEHTPDNDNRFLSVLLYVLGTILVIILLIVALLSFLRSIRTAKARRQSRRNSRNRRRSR